MNKDYIIERLGMLVELIEETSEPSTTQLFPLHETETLENIKYLRENIRGKNPHYDKDLEREFIIDIMKDSNRIWKFRNKIKNGDLDNTNLLEMEETIVMYLDDGSKINAIKFYREWMLDNMDTKVSLRECKDKVDAYDKSRKSQLI